MPDDSKENDHQDTGHQSDGHDVDTGQGRGRLAEVLEDRSLSSGEYIDHSDPRDSDDL